MHVKCAYVFQLGVVYFSDMDGACKEEYLGDGWTSQSKFLVSPVILLQFANCESWDSSHENHES